jgi:hypothetical protein
MNEIKEGMIMNKIEEGKEMTFDISNVSPHISVILPRLGVVLFDPQVPEKARSEKRIIKPEEYATLISCEHCKKRFSTLDEHVKNQNPFAFAHMGKYVCAECKNCEKVQYMKQVDTEFQTMCKKCDMIIKTSLPEEMQAQITNRENYICFRCRPVNFAVPCAVTNCPNLAMRDGTGRHQLGCNVEHTVESWLNLANRMI